MAVFAYTAFHPQQRTVGGTITADTPRQARDLLRAQGLVVERLRQGRPASARRVGWGRSRHDGRKVVTFIRDLATLLAVGVPLLEAVDTIVLQYKGRFRLTLLGVRDRVAAGVSLAAAMREHPRTFDDLCVNIAEVGEDAGTLDVALERLADFKERSEHLSGKLTTALIYPCIVLTMAIGISIFLMTFVVPQILAPLLEQGHPLPLPTRIVKGASDFLLSWGWLLGLVVVALAAGVSAALRTPRGKRLWHGWQLKIPLLGPLIRKQAVVRMAVVMSTLLKSGIVFIKALQIAQRTTGNVIIREAMNRCETAVAAGGDIAESLKNADAFPPAVVQIFAIGQQSGRLEEMLDRLAANYDRQVELAAQRFSSVLEPVLIVLLTGLVLCIALATMLPILEAGDVLN